MNDLLFVARGNRSSNTESHEVCSTVAYSVDM